MSAGVLRRLLHAAAFLRAAFALLVSDRAWWRRRPSGCGIGLGTATAPLPSEFVMPGRSAGASSVRRRELSPTANGTRLWRPVLGLQKISARAVWGFEALYGGGSGERGRRRRRRLRAAPDRWGGDNPNQGPLLELILLFLHLCELVVSRISLC
ncbi:hypothetical protein SEVIR_8G240150v4 [Setaria viridis]